MSQLKTFDELKDEMAQDLVPYLDAYIDYLNSNTLANVGSGQLGATVYVSDVTLSGYAVSQVGGSLNSAAKASIAQGLLAHAIAQGWPEANFVRQTVPEARFAITFPAQLGTPIPTL